MTEENKGYYTPLHVHQKSQLDIYKEIHRVESETQENISGLKTEIGNMKHEIQNLNKSQKEQIKSQNEGNSHLKNISEKLTEFGNWSVGVDSKLSKQDERLLSMETSIEEKKKANSNLIATVVTTLGGIVVAAFGFATAFFN